MIDFFWKQLGNSSSLICFLSQLKLSINSWFFDLLSSHSLNISFPFYFSLAINQHTNNLIFNTTFRIEETKYNSWLFFLQHNVQHRSQAMIVEVCQRRWPTEASKKPNCDVNKPRMNCPRQPESSKNQVYICKHDVRLCTFYLNWLPIDHTPIKLWGDRSTDPHHRHLWPTWSWNLLPHHSLHPCLTSLQKMEDWFRSECY